MKNTLVSAKFIKEEIIFLTINYAGNRAGSTSEPFLNNNSRYALNSLA